LLQACVVTPNNVVHARVFILIKPIDNQCYINA
jgi:hypothetical protein